MRRDQGAPTIMLSVMRRRIRKPESAAAPTLGYQLCADLKRGLFATFVTLAIGLMSAACRGQASRAADTPKQVVVWRTLGSWSGHGNRQTESFTSDTGALRVRWSASRQEPGSAGAFRMTAHSAISGRLLEQVVDHRGPGSGVGYVNQDPHVFYLMVEADHVNWTFSVEEAVAGTVR
jgi:hypothetical protein